MLLFKLFAKLTNMLRSFLVFPLQSYNCTNTLVGTALEAVQTFYTV